MALKEEPSKKCKKAGYYCDKCQYNEARFLEKLRLALHLISCATCRNYSKKNNKLTKILKTYRTNSLSDSEKIQLKSKIENALKNKH